MLTARGQVFVAPAQQGRIVEATRNKLARHRNARFMPDGKSILTLSDESDEIEFWTVPATGVGPAIQLSRDGTVLRWDGVPSPDGAAIAHYDKDQQLWLFDVGKRTQKKIADSAQGDFEDLRWSPDSKWLGILGRLLRKAWFYWQPRVGQPSWNMQFAFRGHIVVLVNERTASDSEAFAEGFRRLGLGQVMGTRTWGGEVWLSSSNVLVDRGIATADETGVYGPEGQWLIEGHGVDPDIVVDNLPHATFEGSDAQLDAALRHLQELIESKPVPLPPPPPYPIKRMWIRTSR